jgi:serine/threonine protein phosphatase PrpC
VFDGHNGSHAAEFASERILQEVTSSQHFPADLEASLVGGAELQLQVISETPCHTSYHHQLHQESGAEQSDCW